MGTNQGHCSECDPLTGCREEEEKKGAPPDQHRERERGGGRGQRGRRRGRELLRVSSAEELESSLAAENTQPRYVPDRLVQVREMMPLISR